MSGKRQATSDLNHDNWDREEEPEERGTFRTASEDELKNRVIKKAKRKITPGNNVADGGTSTKSVFSGFSGFGKPSSATVSSSPFSFLDKIPAVAAANSGAVSSSSTAASSETKPQFSFGSGLSTKTAESCKTSFSFGNSVASAASSDSKLSSRTVSENSEYLKKLSSLNQAVCEWIKSHVDKNPVCILSPIFKDYEKYLKEIENIKKNVEVNEATPKNADNPCPATGMGTFKFSGGSSNTDISTKTDGAIEKISETDTKANGFSFGIKKQDSLPVTLSTAPSFSFNSKPSTTTTAPSVTPSFSFGNLPNASSQPTTASKPFSFTPGGTPFSFGNIKPPEVSAPTSLEGEQNEEDEEPPKNEFKPVVEDDAIYSKKCKVFVKKDGNFLDKGVGTLYLKPVESTGKTQLLVRADTNLGNILVNLILSSAIPAQRMGKNNVMMVCLPTPDVEKPTSMLLRVKTAEEADELLENIDKYKK